MTLRLFILLPLLLCGCTTPRHPNSSTPALTPAQTSRSVEAFRFIGATTTIQEVATRLGPPDRETGSGIMIYVYRIGDGSEVWIGATSNSHILYVRHGSEVLFER
jgi:hypothetical protein